MKNVLITGISGFIGNYLYRRSENTINLSGTYFKNKPTIENITLYNLDLLNIDSFLSNSQKFDTVIHCAAESNLARCEQNIEYVMKVNAKATKKLAEWSEKQKSRFIYFSTDIVFHGDRGNYTEADQPDPINNYGKSKLMGEQAVLEVHSNAVIARIALCLGKRLYNSNSFIDWMIEKVKNNEKISLFYDEYRTPVSASYVAKATWELVANQYKGIIHLTGEEKVNRYEFGSHFIQLFPEYDSRLLIKTSQSLAGYPRPVDVSMKSLFAETTLKIKSERITDIIKDLI